MFNKNQIGLKIYISGHFKLFKTNNIINYLNMGYTIGGDVCLPKQQVLIIDVDKIQLDNLDIFLTT